MNQELGVLQRPVNHNTVTCIRSQNANWYSLDVSYTRLNPDIRNSNDSPFPVISILGAH
jgi:hypothetical protein